jgi:16S rRNA (cytosine1402-N4)-methyltransferase
MAGEVHELLVTNRAGTYLDGTTGEGGHSEFLLRTLDPGARMVLLDLDQDALDIAERRLAGFPQKKNFVHAGFERIREVLDNLGIETADGVLLDLGLCSLHLRSARGFSFEGETELDMRFDRTQQLTAFDVVNDYPREELARLFKTHGQFRNAAKLARKIERQRFRSPIRTTHDLRMALTAGGYARPSVLARAFMSIRYEVNDEMGRLKGVVSVIDSCVGTGGRLCALSYNSAEDREFKRLFVSPGWNRLTRKPLLPSDAEVRANPRARSAKLRAGERV